jgi:hypothetical protein
MAHDLFISYARKDNTEHRITEFVEHLQAEYQVFASRLLEVFFDKDDIHGMEDWRHRILQLFQLTTGHNHPNMETFVGNSIEFLRNIDQDDATIQARFASLVTEAKAEFERRQESANV